MTREIEGPDFHEVEDSDYPEMRIAQEEYQVAFLTGIGIMFPVTFPVSPHFITEVRNQGRDVALSVGATDEYPILAPHPLRNLLDEIYKEPTTITDVAIFTDQLILTVEGENDNRFYTEESYAAIFNRGGFVDRTLVFNIPALEVEIEAMPREMVDENEPGELPLLVKKSLKAKEIYGLVGLIESISCHPDLELSIARQANSEEENLSS